MGSVGTLNGNLCIIRYFNVSPEISTHSQKLSVPSKIEFDGSSMKKLRSFILLPPTPCAYK